VICVYDKIVNNYHAISGTVQTGYFQLGNVKLLQRPKVPEEVMMAAGWEDATGTATVFSVAYSAGDEEVPWGQKIIVHITPIRHDGTVLTENQLDAYFDSLIEETTISAMLAADNAADKLILWVQEVPGTWDDAWERADLFDDLLHRLQAVYYLNEFAEMPTNEELQEFNPAISVNIVIPDYTTNGDAVLCPKECKIKNIAGGNYELTMVHPIDTLGKWKHLQPGAVIRAPIPEEEIENAFAGYEADVYKTIEKADLRELPSEPVAISYPSWSIGANYSVGAKVSWNNKNWKCNYFDETSAYANIAPGSCAWWSEIARKTSGSEALVTLKKGEDLYYIEDADTDWYKMSTYYGIVGYIRKNQVVYDRHLTPSETKPRIIKTQLFRIEKPTVDTKARTVTIKAKHVSYDLNGVLVKDVSIGQASPAMALGRITEGFMMDYPGTIATNLRSDENGTYTNDIKGKNGTFCLLDPDKGIVSTFRAAYKRDNWDLFIMKQTNPDRGFRITYRKNQLGVNWDQDSSGIITRVVPVAKDEAGENLYLPEVWIDSPRINQYPVIKMERLTVKGQVGKAKSEEDETTWTLADLYQEMREKAAERFSVDKADQVTVTVTVDFEQLGDTEEHRELKGLEKILLYDTVTVENEEIGLSIPLYVSEWEWDAIREKIVAVKLVNALDYNKGSVSGYNVQSKSIGSEKLADDVAEGIVTQVVSVMPEYADPNAKRPSSDVVPNTVSADGIVTKGQGQASKVWKTDENGNPAWRDEAGSVTVVDGDPTLAWGTRSKVGTVAGKDIHVTMPANPNTDHYDWSDITNKPDTATRWPSWSEVTGKPSTFTPASGSGNYIRRDAWWRYEDSHNVNDLIGAATFAYTSHGAPVTGPIVDFSASNETGYRLQIQAKYGADEFYYRTRNGDNSTWKDWKRLANVDEAVKSISRSGTTFTATRANGTTFTFDQQDTNTTYSAGNGLELSGTTFSAKLSKSGARFSCIPWIENDGVMEVGKYIDFHLTNGDTGDRAQRITSTDSELQFSGGITAENSITVNNNKRIVFKGAGTGSDTWLQFDDSGGTSVLFGMRRPLANYGPTYYNGSNYYTMLHEGNYKNYGYLPQLGNYYGNTHNLNDVTCGMALINGSTVNSPLTGSEVGYFMCFNVLSSYRAQIVIPYNESSYAGGFWLRTYNDNGWKAWKWQNAGDHYDWSDITNKPANYPGGCTGNAATATYAGSNADGTVTVNSSYCTGSVSYKGIRITSGRRIVTLQWDITFKSSYSSDNVAQICSPGVCPTPATGGTLAVCSGTSAVLGSLGIVNVDGGALKPWYCGTVSGHWVGSMTYVTAN